MWSIRSLVRRAAPLLGTLLVFALAAFFLVRITRETPGDIDEGFYALAAELVGHGRRLYRDFFYPQAPLWPYLMAPFLRLWPSFVVARTVSALLSAGTATLLFRGVWRESRSLAGAALCAGTFLFHDLTWQWLGSVRPYAAATLCLCAALYLVQGPAAPRAWQCALAGAFAAGAVGMRLLCAPAVPVIALAASLRYVRAPLGRGMVAAGAVLYAAWPRELHQTRYLVIATVVCAVAVLVGKGGLRALAHGAAVLLGAGAVALLVYLLIYRADPQAFLFGNVGYHALRHEGGLRGDLTENREYLHAMLGFGPRLGTTALGAHTLPLLVLGLLGLGLPGGERRVAPLLLAGTIAEANLRPNEIFEHYFVLCVAPLCMAAGGAAGEMLRGRGPRSLVPAVLLLGFYLVAGDRNFDERWVHGMYGPWDMTSFRAPLLDRANTEVHRAVSEFGGPLLSPWPGSALGVSGAMMPGFENHFGRNVAGLLDLDERDALHLVTHEDFMEALHQRTPRVVALDRESQGDSREGLRALLLRCGYRPYGQRRLETEVFVLPPSVARTPRCD